MRKFFLSLGLYCIFASNLFAAGETRLIQRWVSVGNIVVGLEVHAQGSTGQLQRAALFSRKFLEEMGPRPHSLFLVPSAYPLTRLPNGSAEVALYKVLFQPIMSQQFSQIYALETVHEVEAFLLEALTEDETFHSNVHKHQ